MNENDTKFEFALQMTEFRVYGSQILERRVREDENVF